MLQNKKSQSGQTLIETVVGLFVLVMAITSAAGLATYSNQIAQQLLKRNTAMGLAKQGVEIVKNIRDTHWLRTPLKTNCYNFQAGDYSGSCYLGWLDPTVAGAECVPAHNHCQSSFPPDLKSYVNGNSSFDFSLSPAADADAKPWLFSSQTSNFRLRLRDVNVLDGGWYYTTSLGSNSDYYRRIYVRDASDLTGDGVADPPYNQRMLSAYSDTFQRVEVISRVWWNGRGCPVAVDWPSTGNCRVELRTYLVNWKNY